MKIPLRWSVLTLLATFSLLFGGFSFASADTIALHLPDNVHGGHIRYQDAFASFGEVHATASVGTLGAFSFWPLDPMQTNGGVISATVTLHGYSDAGVCSNVLWTQSTTTTIVIPSSTSTYPVTMDLSSTFQSLIGTQCIGGTVTPNYSSNALAYWLNDSNNTLAFIVTDQNANVVDLQPQVYAFSSPTELSVTSTVNPLVGFSYLNTDTYDEVGVEVTDQTNNKLSVLTGIQSAIQNSTASYSAVLGLTANHAYRLRGVLLSSVASSSPTYGPYVDFSTISDQFFTATSSLININNITESNAATSTASGVSGFAIIPSYFASRVPFGYIYVIYNAWNSVATSSAQFGALTLDYSALAVSTSTKAWLPSSITFFSTTTVTAYLGDANLALLNALATATIAVTWAMAVKRRATNVVKPV